MPLLPTQHQEVVTAYRHLLKQGLRAVQHSKPARFTVRDRIRGAFRESSLESFDTKRVHRTLQFLEGATKQIGIEHKIIKNLMFVWWEKDKLMRSQARADVMPLRRKAYEEFDSTLEKLNESMGLCIK